MKEDLEERVRDAPRLDPDLSPRSPTNREAARKLGLRYDPQMEVYRDSEGCPERDRYGQPLG